MNLYAARQYLGPNIIISDEDLTKLLLELESLATVVLDVLEDSKPKKERMNEE